MILGVLGSWRSTLIIARRFRCPVPGSIATLSALGNPQHHDFLGGLALAVGNPGRDATVTIETSITISNRARTSRPPS